MLQLFFNISQALRTIRANLLRSVITILIITLGITALVGILTATDVMKSGVSSNFSDMGANSFQITSEAVHTKKGRRGAQVSYSSDVEITYDQARLFKQRYRFPDTKVGISKVGSSVATVRYESLKTNPNIRVMGVDQEYLIISQTGLLGGRNISQYDEENSNLVCVLGYDVAKKLFTKPENAVGKVVSVGANKVQVIGVAVKKGGSMMMNADNMVMLPLQTARMFYGGSGSYGINVLVGNIHTKQIAAEEAEGLFRAVRRVPLGAQNDFSVQQNNAMAEMVLDIVSKIGIAAMVIAIVTLLGSIIGLMNIMLVSVVERTREIGLSKALGARASEIRRQFLLESVVISLMGGMLGIIFSLFIGLALAASFHVPFMIPWAWIVLGVTICTVVGIVSGFYPALKAARLDPIIALRTA
ncbi:ABC transporter permease [Rurimicrobium arvi]|uniref:ABC transporter permease n=1 Tax=Rurimicrobium arvi TaxID=2049916 RepID=A0ABP8MXL4_9BACT